MRRSPCFQSLEEDTNPERSDGEALAKGRVHARSASALPGYHPRALSSLAERRKTSRMKSSELHYRGHRFPADIIRYAVWVYDRFCMSFRDVEDLLAERGIVVSYETIRVWCQKFGSEYTRRLKQHQGRLGDRWHLDEVFIRINGQQQYLWRAVDQDGEVIDILVQPRRDQRAAECFFRRLCGTREGSHFELLAKNCEVTRQPGERFLAK